MCGTLAVGPLCSCGQGAHVLDCCMLALSRPGHQAQAQSLLSTHLGSPIVTTTLRYCCAWVVMALRHMRHALMRRSQTTRGNGTYSALAGLSHIANPQIASCLKHLLETFTFLHPHTCTNLYCMCTCTTCVRWPHQR